MKRLSIILVLIFQYFFSSSQGSGEIIRFESANPFSFNDIIDNLENQKSQDVFGKLIFPEDSAHLNKKYTLIIGVAGSLGWADHHFEYMKMYRDMGIATFELNSFQSRDVTSTVGTQVEVTTASMILDAYRAFEKLSEHPRIDSDRVSITGWSLGGGVTLFSAWLPIKNAINKIEHAEVKPKIILSDIGMINETDISLAKASNAIVIGFNMKPNREAKHSAEQQKIRIEFFNIIYRIV